METQKATMQHTIASGALAAAVLASLSSSVYMTRGVSWPNDAVYATVTNHSTWPCGWGKESSVEFFSTREGLDARLTALREFGRYEDNYYALEVYEWDLGPTLLPEFSVNEGNLPMTYQQLVAAGVIRTL